VKIDVARVGWFLAIAIASAPPAHAQSPQYISASFDDWTASCTQKTQGQVTCESVHLLRPPNQKNPVGQITISRANKSDPYKIFIQIPPNLRLVPGPKLALDDKEPPLQATLEWCLPSRCLADAELSDSTLKALAARTEPGRFEYMDATQTAVTIPISVKGFNSAFEWMEKTASDPTTKPSAAQVCENQFERLKTSGDLGDQPDEAGFMAWCQAGLDKMKKP
jgi:invasion protein IalB